MLTLTAADGLHLGVQTAPLGELTEEVVIPPGDEYIVEDEPRRRPDGLWEARAHRPTRLAVESPPFDDPKLRRQLLEAAALLFYFWHAQARAAA